MQRTRRVLGFTSHPPLIRRGHFQNSIEHHPGLAVAGPLLDRVALLRVSQRILQTAHHADRAAVATVPIVPFDYGEDGGHRGSFLSGITSSPPPLLLALLDRVQYLAPLAVWDVVQGPAAFHETDVP